MMETLLFECDAGVARLSGLPEDMTNLLCLVYEALTARQELSQDTVFYRQELSAVKRMIETLAGKEGEEECRQKQMEARGEEMP